jgi:hypothetical protein
MQVFINQESLGVNVLRNDLPALSVLAVAQVRTCLDQ